MPKMKVTSSVSNALTTRQIGKKIEVDPSSLLRTYELDDYLKTQSSLEDGLPGFFEPGGVSNLQISPELKEEFKRTFWRNWYHLKHVQAGPFAVYNNPTPVDINGMFPVTQGTPAVEPAGVPEQAVAPAMQVPNATVAALAGAGAMAPAAVGAAQYNVVPGVGPATVVPIVSGGGQPANNAEELNKSLETRAVPSDLPVTASPSGDPNTPPLANVPVVNVVGGKYISAPGVIPPEVMEKHPMFNSVQLNATDYFRINPENVGRTLIVVVLGVFLVGVVVWRIRSRKKPKKKR